MRRRRKVINSDLSTYCYFCHVMRCFGTGGFLCHVGYKCDIFCARWTLYQQEVRIAELERVQSANDLLLKEGWSVKNISPIGEAVSWKMIDYKDNDHD